MKISCFISVQSSTVPLLEVRRQYKSDLVLETFIFKNDCPNCIEHKLSEDEMNSHENVKITNLLMKI